MEKEINKLTDSITNAEVIQTLEIILEKLNALEKEINRIGQSFQPVIKK